MKTKYLEFIKPKETEINNNDDDSEEEEIKELERIYLQKKDTITEAKEEAVNKLKRFNYKRLS